MRTTSRVGPSSRTGAGTFDFLHDYDVLGRETPVDRTPLNVEDIPNLDLGAVLKSWDDTLTPRCARDALWRSMGVHDATHMAQTDVAPAEPPQLGEADTADLSKSALRNVWHMALPLDVYALGADARLLAGELENNSSTETERPVCHLLMGPVTATTTYHRALWVLLTGDEVGHSQARAIGAPVGASGSLVVSTPVEQPDRHALEVRPEEQTALEVITALQGLLDLPAASVLRASGISRRTYQNWKATGATPRLNSQARLWDLALTARGWADVLGVDLAAWIRHPDRLKLLDGGKLDDLSSLVLNEQAQQVTDAPWYRDRLAAGYFETVEANLESDLRTAPSASEEVDRSATPADTREPRRARRARRGRPTGGGRQPTT